MFGLMGVARMSGQPGGAFSPLSLFANGEQGLWYDPSDFSSMFQDSAGTTPVTAVGQPVGLILDKRFGLALGAEIITNGDFSDGTTGWYIAPDWSLVGGALVAAGAAGACFPLAGSSVVGVTYLVTIDVSVGSLNVFLGGQYAPQAAPGTFTARFTATNTNGISFSTSAGATIDNISVREIAGNHASQPTAAARPVVSAPHYLTFDAIDDLLSTTFPTLGSACTIARAVPMVGASILTGQTIGAGTWTDSTNHAGLVIIDRALTAGETAALTAYLNAKAGA